MGTFRVAIEIGDAAGERWETVEALVDTGATYTTVPAELLRRLGVAPHARDAFVLASGPATRSEEHTSELQSPCNLVCRLLLEKKKKNAKLVVNSQISVRGLHMQRAIVSH